MIRTTHLLFLLCASALARSEASVIQEPQVTIDVKVSDATTGNPIRLVILTLNGQLRGTTASDGTFRLLGITPGRNFLALRRVGYAELNLDLEIERKSGEAIATLDIPLQPLPAQLAPVTVEAETATSPKLAQFDIRRRMGFGHFITREEFEKWSPHETTDVLRRAPGLSIIRNPNYMNGDTRRFIVLSRRVASLSGNPDTRGECALPIFIDGAYVGNTFNTDIDQLLQPQNIEALEIYRGAAEMPSEFNVTGSACGVLVFWTP